MLVFRVHFKGEPVYIDLVSIDIDRKNDDQISGLDTNHKEWAIDGDVIRSLELCNV